MFISNLREILFFCKEMFPVPKEFIFCLFWACFLCSLYPVPKEFISYFLRACFLFQSSLFPVSEEYMSCFRGVYFLLQSISIVLQNVKIQNVELQNVELQNVKTQKVKLQNIELQNVKWIKGRITIHRKLQNVKNYKTWNLTERQNTTRWILQNVKLQNIKNTKRRKWWSWMVYIWKSSISLCTLRLTT
jgi:hypothetical protein